MDFLFHLLHEKQQEGRIIFLKTIKVHTKGQLISKGLFGILNSSKEQTKKIDLTTMITLVFVRFLEEFEDTRNTF